MGGHVRVCLPLWIELALIRHNIYCIPEHGSRGGYRFALPELVIHLAVDVAVYLNAHFSAIAVCEEIAIGQ